LPAFSFFMTSDDTLLTGRAGTLELLIRFGKGGEPSVLFHDPLG
jgi:hypothetical protein